MAQNGCDYENVTSSPLGTAAVPSHTATPDPQTGALHCLPIQGTLLQCDHISGTRPMSQLGWGSGRPSWSPTTPPRAIPRGEIPPSGRQTQKKPARARPSWDCPHQGRTWAVGLWGTTVRQGTGLLMSLATTQPLRSVLKGCFKYRGVTMIS